MEYRMLPALVLLASLTAGKGAADEPIDRTLVEIEGGAPVLLLLGAPGLLLEGFDVAHA